MKLFGNSLKLVIFDVDGTILDLLKCFQKNLEFAALHMRLPLSPLRDHLEGLSQGKCTLHASFAIGVKTFWPSLTFHEILKFEDTFRQVEELNPYPPIPGAVETIEWLRSRGIYIALCTTNSIKGLHDRLRQANVSLALFDAISTAGNGYPHKPDPRTLIPIFDKIPVDLLQTVYVGDTDADLSTARNAGIEFLAVQSGGVTLQGFLRLGVLENRIVNNLNAIRELVVDGD